MSSLSSSLSPAGRRVIAAIVAFAMAVSMAVMVSPRAQAVAPRDFLREDSTGHCEWDAVGWWVQRCDVWSEAMNRNIPVQIQPAQRGGNAGLYLLDGLRATEYSNAWLHDVNAAEVYEPHNITLVMPVGGAGSFYADWRAPATYSATNPVTYKWETFLTSELPAYLERHFGVSRTNNSIAGLSMGGSAALTLAGKHPQQFRQALSFSGYLFTTLPGVHTMMRFALLDAGGFNINALYGSMLSPDRFEFDPFNQIPNLRDTDVYISAASGWPGPADADVPFNHRAAAIPLEMFSKFTTRMWERRAVAAGVRVTTDYPPYGIHNWTLFGYQLNHSKDHVLHVMNAW